MRSAFPILLGILASASFSMGEEKIDLNGDIDLDDPVKAEERINLLNWHLAELRAKAKLVEVKDYAFRTVDGETSLSELLGDRKKLLVIRNKGTKCPY